MNNQYLIPANSKKSQLIFGIFRVKDLILFGVGCLATIILLLAIDETTLLFTIIKLFPVCVSGFLVFPLGNYHNVLVFIREIFSYYNNRRIYIWKVWCVTS